MSIVVPGTSTTSTTGGLTFLQLAQRLRQECRVSGVGPTAVTGQTGEYQRLLDWTAEAWREVQRSNPAWRFMRNSATCATVQGQALYAAGADFGLSDFGRWCIDYENGDTFRCYDTAAGISSENCLYPLEYDEWRDTYQFGATRSTYSRPTSIAVAPNDSLATGPVAAAGYTLLGDYYSKPVLLQNAGDVPSLPEQYSMVIVYLAMTYYGVSESAPEIYDLGQMKYDKLFAQLAREQAPRLRTAGALC